MSISFRDYVLLSELVQEDTEQLDEAFFTTAAKKLWELVKKKLGPDATDEEIQKEVDRLKKLDKKDLAKVKSTKASKDFHARRKQEIEDRAAKKPQGTRPTIAPKSSTPRQGAAADRAADREWMRQASGLMDAIQPRDSSPLNEAKEFVVVYQLKNSDKQRKWTVKGRDSSDVKRKFGDAHYGAKLISIAPAKPVVLKKEVEVDSDLVKEALDPKYQAIIDELIDDFADGEYPTDRQADRAIMAAIRRHKIPKADHDKVYDLIIGSVRPF